MHYNWYPTTGVDIPYMVELTKRNFEVEIDNIFTPDEVALSRNLTLATVKQFFMPNDELLRIAKDSENKILGYTWAVRNDRAPWSDDEMVSIKLAHLELNLSIRSKVKLVTDMINIWENFAKNINVSIICSTTMRKDQHGFLKLHQKHGYDVRGSYAYKRLNTTQATPAN